MNANAGKRGRIYFTQDTPFYPWLSGSFWPVEDVSENLNYSWAMGSSRP